MNTSKLSHDIEPPFGGDFLAPFGYQADVFGASVLNDAEHLVCDGRFEIQRHLDLSLEPDHIFILDVTTVLTQVEGDDVRPRLYRQLSRSDGVREIAAAGIAQCGHVVNVDPQQGRIH